ncbi:MAG: hypothetical protein WBB28_21745 [Crinalium sp.]
MLETKFEIALNKFKQNPSEENYTHMEQLITTYQVNPPEMIKQHLADLGNAGKTSTESYLPWLNQYSLTARLATFMTTPTPQTRDDLLIEMQKYKDSFSVS